MAGSFSEQLWNRVEEMNDGSLKCKFCGHQFAKDTSLSGIKWHFSGERGRGMAICGQVPKQVQEQPHKTMGQRRKRIEMARLKSGWTLLLTNLILELASAVCDQLSYALVGMVLAIVALLLSTAELIYMERMARRESRSLLPISHRPSPWKPVGTIVDYFGLAGAVWQFIYSAVEYANAREKKENPIKMCLLPFIFLSCVVISKLIKTLFIDESA